MSDPAAGPRSGIGLLPLLLIPAVAVNLLTFLWPVLNLATLSLYEGQPGGAIGTTISPATWAGLVEDSFYTEILVNSVILALTVTGIALVCGYPIALFIHRASDRWRNLLVIVCISPLLLSAVVRTYGWLLILGDAGLVPSLLRGLGMAEVPRLVFNDIGVVIGLGEIFMPYMILGDAGLVPSLLRGLGMAEVPRLVFNDVGVVIGLGEIFMPYMILSLLAGFARLDQGLEDAAASLGAPPFTVFRRIVLPLTVPGILLGCLLAFVLAVSSFVTPKLLGGGRVMLLATEIYDQAIVTLNWPLAAALSVVVLVLFGATLLAYGRMATIIERRIG